MLRLSKKQDYAVLILTYVSTRQGLETTARHISEHFNLSLPYIALILKQLTKHRILRSERGAHGGYTLAGAPSETSLGRILEALDDPVALTECSMDGENRCATRDGCNIIEPIRRINGRIRKVLHETTLADLLSEVTQ
ncbi:MAG: Rrf2 family transcriptional regulator [Planctomycetota bacterium]